MSKTILFIQSRITNIVKHKQISLKKLVLTACLFSFKNMFMFPCSCKFDVNIPCNNAITSYISYSISYTSVMK